MKGKGEGGGDTQRRSVYVKTNASMDEQLNSLQALTSRTRLRYVVLGDIKRS